MGCKFYWGESNPCAEHRNRLAWHPTHEISKASLRHLKHSAAGGARRHLDRYYRTNQHRDPASSLRRGVRSWDWVFITCLLWREDSTVMKSRQWQLTAGAAGHSFPAVAVREASYRGFISVCRVRVWGYGGVYVLVFVRASAESRVTMSERVHVPRTRSDGNCPKGSSVLF